LKFEATKKLLERGTGATYVTEESLAKLEVPIGLATEFPKRYARYMRSISLLDEGNMQKIEQSLLRILTKKLTD